MFCNNIWQYWSLLYQIYHNPKKKRRIEWVWRNLVPIALAVQLHAAAISISGFSDLGNQILFLQISCKNAPLKIFVKCFVAKFNHASCLTPPCWKSSLKNKPRVMKCWKIIVTCSSLGFTTLAKSFLNPFEPLWSFL